MKDKERNECQTKKIKKTPSKIEKEFASSLSTIMSERKLTFAKLEEITGVADSTLNDYYHCRVAIPLDAAKKIADALEVEFSWMIGEGSRTVKKISS